MDRSAQQTEPVVGERSGHQPVCPLCGGPADIIDQFVLYREAGPVLQVRTACTAEDHFLTL
jgi:hypothetical protein